MEPSDELEALAKRHGATSYRNRADTQNPAYGFTEGGLNGLIGEVLAKWGTPQPVARVPLTDEQLWANDEIMSLNADLGWHMETIRMFARAIERAHGITGGQHGAG